MHSLMVIQNIRNFLFKSHFRWIIDGILLFSIVVLLYWAWVSPDLSNKNCGLEKNAAWISVDWTSQPVDEGDVKQLAQNASIHKLHYLFPFTTYVRSDGTFSPSYTYAPEFVAQFRRFNQNTLLLAWVGIPLEWVNLADKGTRKEIIAFVVHLIQEAQFDGVHLNAEAILNDNPNYLIFLEEMRDALGPQYVISIAGSQWLPTGLDKLPLVNDNQLRWNNEYYQAVASRVDQIAVMAYDSVQSYPAVYRLWLREQVRGLSRELKEEEAELLIGISISREHTTLHHPKAENMQNGLAGICAGLLTIKQNEVQGVSIYASWEAEQTDWQLWEEWKNTPSIDK